MSIIDRIVEISNKKGISQKEICSALNITSGTFSNWKSRHTDPPMKYLLKLCDILQTTPEYLITGEETTSEDDTSLTKEEIICLDLFCCLSEIDKARIIERMETMIESYPDEDDATPNAKENVS